MNKEALVEKLAEETSLSKGEAEGVFNALIKIIIREMKAGKSVTIVGFGTFIPRTRHARKGVNPQRPSEKIDIPEVIVPKFKAGKTLKDALKKQ